MATKRNATTIILIIWAVVATCCVIFYPLTSPSQVKNNKIANPFTSTAQAATVEKELAEIVEKETAQVGTFQVAGLDRYSFVTINTTNGEFKVYRIEESVSNQVSRVILEWDSHRQKTADITQKK